VQAVMYDGSLKIPLHLNWLLTGGFSVWWDTMERLATTLGHEDLWQRRDFDFREKCCCLSTTTKKLRKFRDLFYRVLEHKKRSGYLQTG
jgi:hypothetical protein